VTTAFSTRWVGDALSGRLDLLDQTLLPVEERILPLTLASDVREAIVSLRVRGAPAIGVAGAYALILAARDLPPDEASWGSGLAQQADWLNRARPTAVNLSWALGRLVRHDLMCPPGLTRTKRLERLLAEAHAIVDEDRAMCTSMGVHGAPLIASGAGVLTHCNTGVLATAGDGTALAVMYAAHRAGVQFRAYADETRPLLQGARLTAWELRRAGIDVTLLCDSMAAMLMKQKRVDLVLVGADRIAANGDTANKIGTYGLAVMAHYHGVPFYVVAPSSSFDLALADGSGIPIEERKAEEITCGFGRYTAPQNIRVYNPAFDVTPAGLITGIITERGIVERPSVASIAKHLDGVWQPGLS